MPDVRTVGYQSHERKHTGLKIGFVLGTLLLGFSIATQVAATSC